MCINRAYELHAYWPFTTKSVMVAADWLNLKAFITKFKVRYSLMAQKALRT